MAAIYLCAINHIETSYKYSECSEMDKTKQSLILNKTTRSMVFALKYTF